MSLVYIFISWYLFARKYNPGADFIELTALSASLSLLNGKLAERLASSKMIMSCLLILVSIYAYIISADSG